MGQWPLPVGSKPLLLCLRCVSASGPSTCTHFLPPEAEEAPPPPVPPHRPQGTLSPFTAMKPDLKCFLGLPSPVTSSRVSLNNRNLCSVLEARGVKSSYQRSHAPSEALGKSPSWPLPAPGGSWQSLASSLQSLPPSSHGLFLCVCVCVLSCFYKDTSHWV